MSSDLDVEIRKNDQTNLCFGIMLLIGIPCFLAPVLSLFVIPVVVFASVAYFIYFLVSEGHAKDIVWGVVKGFLIVLVASVIPIIGPIILILWILYNIGKAIDSIKSLLPDAVFSIALYACLLYPFIDEVSQYSTNTSIMPRVIAAVLYVVIAFNYANRLKKQAFTTKDQLFKLSLMWISAPLIFILIATIVSSVRSAFRTVISTTSAPIRVTQNVSGYMRGDTVVSNYTREVTKTITTTTTSVLPGTGAITASVAGSLSSAKQQEEVKAAPLSVNSLNKESQFKTNKDENFYCHLELDDKKIKHFYQKALDVLGEPLFTREEILYYFDETVFGKGDHGVVLTQDGIYCVLGKLYDSFYLDYAGVQSVVIKGKLTKEIIITDDNADKYTITLTQSNKGAEKIAQLIKAFSHLA